MRNGRQTDFTLHRLNYSAFYWNFVLYKIFNFSFLLLFKIFPDGPQDFPPSPAAQRPPRTPRHRSDRWCGPWAHVSSANRTHRWTGAQPGNRAAGPRRVLWPRAPRRQRLNVWIVWLASTKTQEQRSSSTSNRKLPESNLIYWREDTATRTRASSRWSRWRTRYETVLFWNRFSCKSQIGWKLM